MYITLNAVHSPLKATPLYMYTLRRFAEPWQLLHVFTTPAARGRGVQQVHYTRPCKQGQALLTVPMVSHPALPGPGQ
jgi:hypothetical protein